MKRTYNPTWEHDANVGNTPMPATNGRAATDNGDEDKSNDVYEECRNPQYFVKLASLNRTFIKWIDSYMSKGQSYDFTPVCNDYIRFITKLQKDYPLIVEDDMQEPEVTVNSPPEKLSKKRTADAFATSPVNNHASAETFKYTSTPFPKVVTSTASSNSTGITSSLPATASPANPLLESKPSNSTAQLISSAIATSITTTSTTAASTVTASNVSTNLFQKFQNESKTESSTTITTSTSTLPTFSFKPTNSLPVSFGTSNSLIGASSNGSSTFGAGFFAPPPKTNGSQDNTQGNNGKNDDDEYVPPKAETVDFNEDALYTVRCKLFYLKDNKYVEKGVGMLYVKKQSDKEDKYQLLIRADNTLGTILLNIQLSASLPIVSSKSGVLLTCVPNPPIEDKKKDADSDKKTVTFYIKVKNNDVREELMKNLAVV